MFAEMADIVLFPPETIKNEAEIVWLEDIDRLPYVRQIFAYARTRRRSFPWDYVGRRVGYATLRDGAPGVLSGTFLRRLLFLKDYDRDNDPGGVYRTGSPCEAVDPQTVKPGVMGERP